MRTDQERIADIQRASETISDYLGGLTEAAFLSDRKTIDAAFFNVIVIGEAVNSLLAPRKSMGQASDKPRRTQDCAIVEE